MWLRFHGIIILNFKGSNLLFMLTSWHNSLSWRNMLQSASLINTTVHEAWVTVIAHKSKSILWHKPTLLHHQRESQTVSWHQPLSKSSSLELHLGLCPLTYIIVSQANQNVSSLLNIFCTQIWCNLISAPACIHSLRCHFTKITLLSL